MNEFVASIVRDAAGVVLSFVFIVGIGGIVDHLFWKRKRKQALFEEVYKAKLATSERIVELCLETNTCLSNLFQKWSSALDEAKQKKTSRKLSDDMAIRLRQANNELKNLVYRQMNVVGRVHLYFSSTTIAQVISVSMTTKEIQENPYKITDGYNPEDLLQRIMRLNGSLREEFGLEQLSGPDQLRDVLYSRSRLLDEKHKAALSHLLTRNTTEVVRAIDFYIEKGDLPEDAITDTVKETLSLLFDFERDFGRQLAVAAARGMKNSIASATLKSGLHL